MIPNRNRPIIRDCSYLSPSLGLMAWLAIGLAVLGPFYEWTSLQARVQETPRRPYAVSSDKQLFIDNLLIDSSRNVALTMNPPVKTGEHCIVAGHPWEDFYVGGWNTVMEDEGIYKMWYDAASWTGGPGDPDGARFQCYATSRDGIHWNKPKLGLVEFQGSKDNNIVLTNTTGAVFLDPKKQDGNRFKYTGWWKTKTFGSDFLWFFTSPDGMHWKPYPDHPVLKGHYDTQNEVFWDDRIGKYVGYFRIWAPLRKVSRAETTDLKNWPEPQVVFSYDNEDPVESDHYNPGVIKYAYAPNIYLMFSSPYYHYPTKRNDGPLDIQLATSRDGIHWNRLDRRPYVRLGVSGSYDGGAIYMTLGILRRENELWMYYTGFDFTHGDYDRKTRKKGVISRLVQRLDGFISADAAYAGGELTTIPIIFDGKRLVLNVDTGALGSTQVEILNDQGLPIQGFGAEDCDPIIGNYIAQQVSWKGNSDVEALAGKAVRLRFVMRNTKLYAFQFVK